MLADVSTETDWSQVITDLQNKQHSNQLALDQLRAEKKSLALSSAMGNAEAKTRLAKLNAELTRLALDADDFIIAVAAATAEKQKAEQILKDAAERERQQELGKLATSAINAATKYTEAVRAAVDAGRHAKEALREMTKLAKPGETTNINRLMDTSPYGRAAEFLGMREFLEFAPYRGPVSHLMPAEDEFTALLARFLPSVDRKE